MSNTDDILQDAFRAKEAMDRVILGMPDFPDPDFDPPHLDPIELADDHALLIDWKNHDQPPF